MDNGARAHGRESILDCWIVKPGKRQASCWKSRTNSTHRSRPSSRRECRGPLLFNSPHSGRVYPREFLRRRGSTSRRCAARRTFFVDELIAGVVARGYPLVRAHFPRCYVDVNREPYELDPRMFDGRLPSFANTRSMRVAGGLGTVARVVGDAQEIYDQRIAGRRSAAADRRPLQTLSSRACAGCSCGCIAISAPPC